MMRKDWPVRYTLPNPSMDTRTQTYRARMKDFKSPLRFEYQMGEIWAFGELIDALGRAEDREDERKGVRRI